MSESSAQSNLTVVRERHGWFETLVNFGCWVLRLLGMPQASTKPERVIRTAEKVTGLKDLGDPVCLTRLERLLGEVEARDSTSLSRVYFNSLTRRALVNRMREQEHFAANPEIRSIPIERPIFVLGFPRTGTTLLQNLLAQEPGRRTLKFWELTRPAPLDPDPERDRKKRIALCDSDLAWAYRAAPEMAKMHEVRSTTSEECWPLFSMSFSALSVDISGGLRDYGSWLLEQDMEWCYREYRERLKMLLHREPAEQLVLKCPEHLWFLDSLLEVFPDACIVWTHREPMACIASYCSMVSLNLRTVWGGYDAQEVGDHISRRFHQGVSRAMAVRDGAPAERFFDVDFFELVKDPLGMVERINSHFGFESTAAGRSAMETYMQTERKDARGKHRYDAGRYGLESEAVAKKFAGYTERFDIG